MPRPAPEWKPRNPVEAVAHEPQPSGLLEAFNRLPMPDVRETVAQAARSLGGSVRLDAIAADRLAHAEAHGADPAAVAPGVVRTIADALDEVALGRVSLGGVVLIEAGVDDSGWNAAAYRWPDSFTGWAHIKRGSVEDCTVLAALAVGVALWGRLPTADEVAAWMDEDEPVTAVEVG